jgi:hypothetical protein
MGACVSADAADRTEAKLVVRHAAGKRRRKLCRAEPNQDGLLLNAGADQPQQLLRGPVKPRRARSFAAL